MSTGLSDWMYDHRLTIVVGHSGSGKTEFSVNLAVALAQVEKNTVLADLDIVNTQLLIEGENLSEDGIHDYITQNIPGDCLLAVGDEDLIKLHFHTNEPWKVLEYAASLGDLFDIVVENMERQENGLQG